MGQNLTVSYGKFVVRWRWPVLVVSLALAAALIVGMKNLTFSTDYRVFFGPDNPQLAAQDHLERTYTKVDMVTIGVRPREGDMFTPRMLGILYELTEEAWQIPYVVRVDSLPNYQHTVADGDDLVVDDLVRDPADLSPARLAEIRDVALSEPSLSGRLISTDGTTSQVMITLEISDTAPETLKRIVDPVREMAARVEEQHPDVDVALSGNIMLSNAFSEAAENDSRTLIPGMFGVLALGMWFFLRSFSGMISSMLVVLFSVLSALGLVGHLGFQLNSASISAPIIILTIAVADAIHLLMTCYVYMHRGMDRKAATVESLRINFQPVFLTSLTTAIGFLSLNFNDSPPFRDLGNISAIGVGAAWFYSMTLLPALMVILPMKPRGEKQRGQVLLENYVEWVIARKNRILTLMILMVVGTAVFIPRLVYNDKFIEFFDTDIEFRRDSDFLMKHLAGPYTMEVSVPAGEDGAIAEPAYLNRLQAFTEWLKVQPEVVHVFSMVDVMKRLNKSMHGDDPGWYRLPDRRDLAAQYLLLYEMSLPYGLDLNNQIDVGKSATRVTAILGNINSHEMIDLKQRTDQWFRENVAEEELRSAGGTSVALIFAFLTQRTFDSMFWGTGVAFLLISLCLVFALKSLKLGLVSLVPNIIPAIVAFGLWAAFVGEIGLYASGVTATALGMIVDCTVHFLSKYKRAREEKNFGARDSVRYAFAMVGAPLWVSSLVLIFGFCTLGLSDYVMNAKMGILTAQIIAVAMVTDFLLLPTILLFVDKKKGEKHALSEQKA
tara:strand:+ start:902 stop:3235 length:2334 start_codon:yes stop_codon:yes gene_type:complete